MAADRRAQSRYALSAWLLSAVLVGELSAVVALALGGWRVVAGGTPHSAVLLLAVALGGLAGCLAVLLAYPLTSSLQPVATAAFSTGMGLNGLLASVVALVQAPSQANRFSIDTYFAIVAVVIACSLAAHLVLWHGGFAERALGAKATAALLADDAVQRAEHANINSEPGESSPLSSSVELADSDAPIAHVTLQAALRHCALVCGFQFVICFLQYVLMSLSPFAFAPFPNQGALLLYSGVAGNILGPLARAATNYLHIFDRRALMAMTALVVALSLAVFLSVFVHLLPGALIALLAVAQAIAFSFEETTLFTKVAVEISMPTKPIASRAVGIANQAGACTGSLTGFFIAQALYTSMMR